VFDQLTQVVQGDPPCLNDVRFSPEFIDFVNTWFVLCVLDNRHLIIIITAIKVIIIMIIVTIIITYIFLSTISK